MLITCYRSKYNQEIADLQLIHITFYPCAEFKKKIFSRMCSMSLCYSSPPKLNYKLIGLIKLCCNVLMTFFLNIELELKKCAFSRRKTNKRAALWWHHTFYLFKQRNRVNLMHNCTSNIVRKDFNTVIKGSQIKVFTVSCRKYCGNNCGTGRCYRFNSVPEGAVVNNGLQRLAYFSLSGLKGALSPPSWSTLDKVLVNKKWSL